MFINFTNHPSDKWDEEQKSAALEYGDIVDIPFPDVAPEGDSGYVKELAAGYVERIISSNPECVLCQGEFNVAFEVITALKAAGIKVVAACSRRLSREKKLGERVEKVSYYKFVRFREY